VTFLIATYSGALLLAGPLWGRLSDRIGRKPVLLISFCGTAAAFTILAFADQLWMLFLARGLAGALSGDIAAAPAYAADVSTPEKRAKSMGILGAAFGLAFTIGPGIGALLVGAEPQDESYRNIPLISAGLSLLTLILAILFLPESRKAGDKTQAPAEVSFLVGLADSLRFRHIALVVAIIFMISFVFSSMESTLPLWSEVEFSWGPQQVGYLFVFAGLVAVIAQGGLIGPLTRRFGEGWVVVGATLLLAMGMLGVAQAQSLAPLLFAVACLAGGFGLSNPALQSLVSRLSRAGTTGGALGLTQSASSLARVTGPPLAGFLFENHGHNAPYLFGGLVMLGVVALATILRLRLAREEARPAEGAS